MLNRRNFLAATAGSIATGALPALAAQPYTLNHGAFAVTVVSDGHLVLPTSFLAPDAPKAEREPLLKAAGQTDEQYDSPTNVTLIAAGQDLILVDMGSGDRFMPTAGKLWQNLKAAGVDKGKITKVIFTHGHPDHLWGTVDELDELVIPDATFFVASTLPSRITVTRSASSMISVNLCVTITTARPFARNSRSTANRRSFSLGVSTAVGSSRISSRASR